ncbi:MAG: class F sortase [Actinomycetota bacterium]
MNRSLPLGFMLRSGPARLAALVLTVLLVGSACSGADPEETATAAPADAVTASTVAGAGADGTDNADAGDDTGSTTAPSGGSLAELVSELPAAPVGFPEAASGPRPTTLTIESLGIADAPVIGVGVEPSGAMEVPPADQVGWYRYSPTPGQAGSSILAAHIAYDGEDGVFVRLSNVEAGAIVDVTDDEGTVRSYRVETVDRYDKTELPEDVVFARSGTERLVLVTCGGRFDPVARSYDDNVVVVATPLEASS